MRNHYRIAFARVLLPIVFGFMVVAPYRDAMAFVAPPGVIPPPAFVATAGPSPVSVAIGALAVGAVVGYVLVGAVFGDDDTDAVRVQVGAQAGAAPSAPLAPSTAQGTGGISPADAAMPYAARCSDNVPISSTWSCGVQEPLPDCLAWAAADRTYNVGCKILDSNNAWNGSFYYRDGSSTTAPLVYPGATNFALLDATCPAGYSGATGSCVLSNSRLVAPDSKQDVLLSGTGSTRAFSIPGDVDTPSVIDGSMVAPILRGNGSYTKTAYIYGRDGSGRTALIEVAVSSDGTQTYVRHYIQDDSSGQSQVLKTSATVDTASGTVVSVQKDVQVGSISTPSATTLTQTSIAAPTSTTAPQVTTTTATPISSSGEQQSIVFPSDYARTGEAATAANTLAPKLDTLHNDLTATAPAPVDPTLPDAQSFTDFGTSFDALKGWSLPGHTSQCPTGSFSTPWGQSYTVDSHCVLIADHFGDFASAMSVVWTVLALFLILRA